MMKRRIHEYEAVKVSEIIKFIKEIKSGLDYSRQFFIADGAMFKIEISKEWEKKQ